MQPGCWQEAVSHASPSIHKLVFLSFRSITSSTLIRPRLLIFTGFRWASSQVSMSCFN